MREQLIRSEKDKSGTVVVGGGRGFNKAFKSKRSVQAGWHWSPGHTTGCLSPNQVQSHLSLYLMRLKKKIVKCCASEAILTGGAKPEVHGHSRKLGLTPNPAFSTELHFQVQST